ncbi:prepilin-type N-terminal cleavage/methylation domain-containing protein [Corallococcus sp. 4LFB]|uniref:prepilin-type N-terminal cleavage/methylation domain-containing protein n=1 Tax=Corallococcus sp. 4LFB TaxID=3383249 RepID=UPI003975B167
MRLRSKLRAKTRGMTLLETMVAAALATIILAAATALLLAGGRVVHNTEHVADSHDHARLAGETLLSAVRQAGAGMSEGLWVVSGGTPQRINPSSAGTARARACSPPPRPATRRARTAATTCGWWCRTATTWAATARRARRCRW